VNAGPAQERDPGLQPERTRLAWRRTTLASTVATVLAVKSALHGGAQGPGILACALCCALWLGFLRVAHRRIRTLATTTGPRPLAPRHAAAAVLCTVAMAACGAALVLRPV
jgi:H+/Cl- antiporter ClcA